MLRRAFVPGVRQYRKQTDGPALDFVEAPRIESPARRQSVAALAASTDDGYESR